MRTMLAGLAAAGTILAWGGGLDAAGPRTVQVRVSADSEARGYEARRALDGDPNTMWHTEFRSGNPPPPHELTVDLGRAVLVRAVHYLPRRGAGNGTIGRYALYLGEDLERLGPPAAAGELPATDGWKRIELDAPRPARYVRLRALAEVRGRPWASAAEIRIVAQGCRFVAAGAGAPTERPPAADDVEGVLDLAQRTLAFVEQAAPRPEMAAELARLARRAEQAEGLSDAERTALTAQIRRLRRRIILSHPLLDFDRLLINKRPPPAFSHQSDQYLGRYSRPGEGLVILDDWKTSPKETVLLRGKLPVGSVLHPDLSFDGRRILFSYCDHTEPRPEYRRFWIYEIGVDGQGLRRITGTARDPLEGFEGRATVLIEDFDPCYLPDGGIAFVSTRNQGGVRCHHGGRYCPTYTLYRCDADGSNIRPMVFGEANEWDPSVLHDGRIIWTRWDYINRHDTIYQSLWTIRPDGTGAAVFYGNYTRNPCSIAEARAIPGSSKIVATATAHHSYTSGSIIVIDPSKGQDGPAPLTRVTPEAAFPETEGWPNCSFATPWPLSEDLFLAAYSPEPKAHQGGVQSANAFAIYLIDTLGGRELIYRDPDCSCFSPIPLVPRPAPPALAPTVPAWSGDPQQATGRFFVENVYQSTQPIPPGSVKRLRVIRIYPQPTIRAPDRSQVLFELPKRILGEVPVEPDGSAAFEAPAGQPLAFQLVDEHGMAVMGMRTFVFLHPNETTGCVGCHESRHGSPRRPPRRDDLVFRRLEPPAGPQYESGLSFAKTVQPVLDRYCISCHGLEKTEAGLDLLGVMQDGPIRLGKVHASRAYLSLVNRPGLVALALRNQETPFSKPMDYYSHAGRLARLVLEGDQHHRPLDRESFQRVAYWLDLNGPFFGDYSWNRVEWRRPDPEGERALREHIARVLGPEIAEQPFAALVNAALPEESRILKAPLARRAGGWGQLGPLWRSTDDPGYQQMRRLVAQAIAPLAAHDVQGGCNQDPCQCRSCWVRQARAEYRRRAAAQQALTSDAARPTDDEGFP